MPMSLIGLYSVSNHIYHYIFLPNVIFYTIVIRRKTIYEYHRADLKKENISNNTAIYFTALPSESLISEFVN